MATPSPDSPIRVDWLAGGELGPGGRLGMTILPGKHGASTRYPGLVYRRDLAVENQRVIARKIDVLCANVCPASPNSGA